MDKDQAAAAKQRAANIDTLRTLHNNNIELRHRVDGKTMTFNADAFFNVDDGGPNDQFTNSGYNREDWIPAADFTNPEGPDHDTDPQHKHPAFEGTGQRVGTFLGETPEERAARGDESGLAERSLGHIDQSVAAEVGKTSSEILKQQQGGQTDPGASGKTQPTGAEDDRGTPAANANKAEAKK